MRALSTRRAATVATLALIACTASGAAFAQATGDTVDLATTYVQRIDGAHAGDDAGDRVTSAGDVNHDGRDDLLIGAYTADPAGRTSAGAAYIVRSASGRHVSLGSSDQNVVEIHGAHKGDRVGEVVNGVGDVNGDGRPDQAIGSYGAHGYASAGPIWLILSTGGKRFIDLRHPGSGVVRIDGSTRGALIDAVAAAGDVNGDGIADLVVGENDGSDLDDAFVILGRRDFQAIDLRHPGPGVIAIHPAGQSGFGRSVAGVGDVNGDGLADVAIGYDGGAVVVFGARVQPASITVSGPSFSGYDIGGGVDAPSSLGAAVAGVGDVNGDGHPDVAVGASTALAQDRARAGVVSVYYGKASADALAYPPAPGTGMRIFGAGRDDRAGYAIAGPGDVTGDGRPDIVVGAFLAGGLGRVDAGVTYLVSPPAGGADVDLSLLGPGVRRWVGSHRQEQSAYAVAGADVNGDGKPEIAIGAGFADHSHRDAGSVYLVDPR